MKIGFNLHCFLRNRSAVPKRDIQRKQNAIICYRSYWKLSLFTFSSEENRRRIWQWHKPEKLPTQLALSTQWTEKKVGYKNLLWRKKEKKCSWSITQNIYFPRLSKRKILRRQDKWVFYVFLGTYRTESGISPNRKIKEAKNLTSYRKIHVRIWKSNKPL